VSGWFADRFGIRKVYLAAITIFTIGSLLCALSQSLTFVVISRVIQGIGGSMLLPIGRLAVIRAFPGDKFIGALSFVAVPALIAPLVGPSLGGWIVEYSSWHWIFLVNIPIGIAGCIATYKAMPEDDSIYKSNFDVIGFLLLAFFMVSTSVSLDSLSGHQMPYAVVVIILVFGFASLAAYFLHISKHTDSFFSLKLFKVRTYSIGILGNLFSRIGTSSMPFLIPLYLQVSLGMSPLIAGLFMLPVTVAAILGKQFVAPLIEYAGYKKFLLINTLLVSLSMAGISLMDESTSATVRIVLLFIFGSVNSMQFTAMNTLTLKDLDRRSSTGGNTLFSMVQMLAMSFGVATASAVLSTFAYYFGSAESKQAFQFTFLCMGALTCISMCIFSQLSANTTEAPKT
ncbi:MAG: MFS transporter, partial [Bdellovibrionales bacterium]|nr:MFS transporter [Bdellovibrionales bacterium]